MNHLKADLRQAFRGFRKSPGFAVVITHIDNGRALWTAGAATIAALVSIAVFCVLGPLRAQEAPSPYVIGTTRQLHSDVLGEGRRVARWVARVIVNLPGRERGAVALTITFSVSERVHELSGLCQNTLTPARSRDRLASLGL